jgi:phage baseplate assembly protein W
VSTKRFLGKGWSYPILPDGGALDYAEGPEKVAQSIRIIIETEPGERIMRPAFGCGLRRYLMRPNSSATRALIRHDVERGLGAFEPRIRVTDVAVEPGDDPSLVFIRIAYVHLRDKSPGNFVYPFYLE